MFAMASIVFTFGNWPGISVAGALFIAGLLKTRATPRSLQLAHKLVGHAECVDPMVTRVMLTRPEMIELLVMMNAAAADSRLHSDALYRLRAELESAINQS
jgi:hypothetical protein